MPSKALLIASALILLYGCAPVISKETLKTVDREISFSQVAKDPGAYVGKSVVFGGTIINVDNQEGRTVMEVLQEGLDYRLKPVLPEESEGRFLVEFPAFKDPAVYSKGRGITVAGTIKGVEEGKVGKTTYKYPVIEPREHHLWRLRGYDPGTRIGIGLGFGYTHID